MTPPTYLEQDFEAHIEQHLLNSGYHSRVPSEYNKENCLIPAEVLRFIQTSQSKMYEKRQSNLGADTDQKLFSRLAGEISKHGALHILRKGFKTRGCHFKMAFLKPASGMNPEAMALYRQNRSTQTAYLWEDILQPDTLLNLIQNYLHVQKNTEKYYDKASGAVKSREYEVFIFPRYHQLDAVRNILAAVEQEGVGKDYLVQHSAGSGKSNSIAWLAHQLASFYRKPTDKDRVFNSIVVVTDRRVLDKQLHISYLAFTATPKGKTLELFGRRNDSGNFTAFHTYSMRQATFLEEETDPDKLHDLASDLKGQR